MEGGDRATCRIFYRTTCAFYTHHHEYRAAAAVMYTYSQRLENEFRHAVSETEGTQREGDAMGEEERKIEEEKKADRRGGVEWQRGLGEYLNERLSALAAAAGALRAAPAGQRWLLSFGRGEEEEEEEEGKEEKR